MQLMREVKRLELDIINKDLPYLAEEKVYMQQGIDQLKQETEIVDWYIKVVEDGLDTKQLMQDYYAEKERSDHLEKVL